MPRNKQPGGKQLILEEVIVESGANVRVGSDLLVNSGDEDQPYVAHVTGVFADKKDSARLKVFWYYFPDDVPRGRQPYHARNEIFKSNHADELSSKSVIWTCTVLSLEKWIGFLSTEANPEGPKTSTGPIVAGKFDIEEDLAACKTVSAVGKKRIRDGDEENPGASRYPEGKAANGAAEEDESMEEDFDDEGDDKANAVYISRHEYDAVKQQWKDVEVPVFCSCNLPYNPDLDMAQCEGCNEWYHPDCLELPDDDVKHIGRGQPWTCPNCKRAGTVAPRT